MDCSPPASSVEVPGKNIGWSRLPFPSLGDLSKPGIEPASPALAGGFFTTEPTEKPQLIIKEIQIKITMRYYFTLVRWLSSKSTKMNAGEGVEKREPSYTVGGNINW